ncbi:MAG: AAA family ATPase [Flavobacteriaceae bacterium]|nr:AAA family ATPase [Flavobacteriaceae bacterium]
MKTNIKKELLNSIGTIYEKSEGCKLKPTIFKELKQELSVISNYFGTNKVQSFFIANIYAMNYGCYTVDLSDLSKHLDAIPTKILEFSDDFEKLVALNILEISTSKRNHINLAIANNQYVINKQISVAILKNKPLPKFKQEKQTIYTILEKVQSLGEELSDEKINTLELRNSLRKLMNDNSNYALIERVNSLNLEISEKFLFLYLVWETISGYKSTDISRALDRYFDSTTEKIEEMQEFINGTTPLVNENFVEIVEAGFFNNTGMKLTKKSGQILEECGIKLFTKKVKRDNILFPKDIPFRKLIFSKTEMQQIFTVKDLLQEDKFKETQQRLIDKNLPKGIAILLHGVPGTGKTEVAKQIAKETNRELMKVEISKSKSAWFGESEKLIKKIFTDYKDFAKECEQTPILLFNEADAIISKRKDVGSSSVAETENAIQNIILEELENFEGILIATTNLVKNLDTAFERRFLFKIPFQKPNIEIRTQIWQSKISCLSLENARILAEKYDFSGGQIDNIFRKKEIHEIIYGKEVSFENLCDFCSQESMLKQPTKRIGFN